MSPRAAVRAAALVLGGILAGGCDGGEAQPADERRSEHSREERDVNPWIVSYELPTPSGGGLSIVVGSNDECQVTLTGNAIGAKRRSAPVIGGFLHRLDDGTAESLRADAQAAIDALVLPPPAVRPGTLFFEIGIAGIDEEGGNASFPTAGDVPAPAKAFRERIEAIADEVLRHPGAALAGSAGWIRPRVAGGEAPRVRLVLSNPGSRPITFADPAGAEEDDAIVARLRVEKDVPVYELEAEDRVSADLVRDEIAALDEEGEPAPSRPGPQTTLAPGESRTYEVEPRRDFYLAAGRYRGVLTVTTALSADGADGEIPGTLHVELDGLTVAEKGDTE